MLHDNPTGQNMTEVEGPFPLPDASFDDKKQIERTAEERRGEARRMTQQRDSRTTVRTPYQHHAVTHTQCKVKAKIQRCQQHDKHDSDDFLTSFHKVVEALREGTPKTTFTVIISVMIF